MRTTVRVFLDTSALFAAIWSATGGGREILRLGEAGVLHLRVSSAVLKELEDVLRRKAPTALGTLALLLNRAGVAVVEKAPTEILDRSRELTGHPGDAKVVAAAWRAAVDYFVTLDRKHFLENDVLQEALPFPVGTPGDFLEWYRERIRLASSEQSVATRQIDSTGPSEDSDGSDTAGGRITQ